MSEWFTGPGVWVITKYKIADLAKRVGAFFSCPCAHGQEGKSSKTDK